MADIKRLNYFTSQFLVEKDFKDEQSYFVDMRRRHNQLFHSSGVAGGLAVSKGGDKIANVAAGAAVDQNGREIVLLDPQAKDLSSFGTNADVYLTLRYQEVSDPADHYSAGGVDNFTRTTERPLLEASTTVPASDGSVVALAKVSLDAAGNIGKIDNTVRKMIGSQIDPASNLTVNNLTVTANATIGGNLGIGVANPPQQLSITGGLGFANQNAADKKLYSPADGQLEWMTNAAAAQHGFALSHQGQQRILLDINGNSFFNGGNVGIGTATPLTTLHIRKDVTGALGPSLTLMNGQGSPGAGASIDFDGYDTDGNAPTARIQSSDNGNFSSHLLFLTKGSGAANQPLLERLRLTADGFVGIGTPTPDRSLTIANSVVGSYMNVKDATHEILMGVDSTGGILSVMTNHDLVFRTGSNSEKMRIQASGNVGIGTATPGLKLDVADRMRVRQGASGTAGIWLFQTTPNADRAFVGMASDTEVGFWGNSGTQWGLTVDTTTSTCKLLASSNPIYVTKTWNGFPDVAGVTNAAEISNDIGTYKTLMIIGNKSGGLGRRVSVWDRFEVNGTFVNNSSIEAKQDVQALSEEDYRDIHCKLLKTPIYRYRFKASGIDQKVRMGVISEESPSEILDETGKFVSFLDYVGFLFAALKAQANEINRLAVLIDANAGKHP